MRSLHVEPSCYTFVATGDDKRDARVFREVFWPNCHRLMAFADANEVSVAISPELFDAVASLFPYASLAASHESSFAPREAVQIVVRFLDRRARYHQYGGREDAVLNQLVRRGPVYEHDDIWLAWADLLGALVSTASTRKWEAIASDDARSSFPAGCATLVLPEGAIDLFRLPLTRWPAGMMDPESLNAMKQRKDGTGFAVRWEDTGNLPSRAIQKALKRTADACSDIVARVGTTYRNPDVAETCKLSLGRDCSDVEFRISDGHCTFKGMFATTATDRREQSSALRYIWKEYRRCCLNEHFEVSGCDGV